MAWDTLPIRRNQTLSLCVCDRPAFPFRNRPWCVYTSGPASCMRCIWYFSDCYLPLSIFKNSSFEIITRFIGRLSRNAPGAQLRACPTVRILHACSPASQGWERPWSRGLFARRGDRPPGLAGTARSAERAPSASNSSFMF